MKRGMLLTLLFLLAGCASAQSPTAFRREAVLLPPRLSVTVAATVGSTTAGSMTFTDPAADFTPALETSVVHITGAVMGTCAFTYYFIEAVISPTELTLAAPPCSTDASGISYTIGRPSPVQGLIALLGALAYNPIFQAAQVDAADTLTWVNGPTGPTDPLKKFRAAECATCVQLAIGDFQVKAALFQQILSGLDAQLGSGGPGLEPILFFTKLRYGDQPTSPAVQFQQIKADIFTRVSAVIDGCRGIFPAKQAAQIVKLATKAGLIGVSAGAAAPILPLLGPLLEGG